MFHFRAGRVRGDTSVTDLTIENAVSHSADINGFKDELADADCKGRGMNLMFTAAVEFGFGSK